MSSTWRRRAWLVAVLFGIRLGIAAPSLGAENSAGAPPGLAAASQVPALALPNAIPAAASGGWRPHNLNACGLAVGLMVGGALGMPLNPYGGATAFSIGFHLAIFACT